MSTKKKIVMFVSVSLLLVGSLAIMFLDKCVQPTPTQVAVTQLRCAQAVDVESFVAEACTKLYNNAECEFAVEDRPHVERLFLDKVNECALKALAEHNRCTDKYEAL